MGRGSKSLPPVVRYPARQTIGQRSRGRPFGIARGGPGTSITWPKTQWNMEFDKNQTRADTVGTYFSNSPFTCVVPGNGNSSVPRPQKSAQNTRNEMTGCAAWLCVADSKIERWRQVGNPPRDQMAEMHGISWQKRQTQQEVRHWLRDQ